MTNEWDDFGQQPGTHLWWARTRAVRRELHTAEQQTVACLRYGLRTTVSTGGRTFTWKPVAGSSRPGIAEIVRPAHREGGPGHLVAGTPHYPAVGQAISDFRTPSLRSSLTAMGPRAINVPLARSSGRVNWPTHRSAKSAVPVSGELEHPVTRD